MEAKDPIRVIDVVKRALDAAGVHDAVESVELELSTVRSGEVGGDFKVPIFDTEIKAGRTSDHTQTVSITLTPRATDAFDADALGAELTAAVRGLVALMASAAEIPDMQANKGSATVEFAVKLDGGLKVLGVGGDLSKVTSHKVVVTLKQ